MKIRFSKWLPMLLMAGLCNLACEKDPIPDPSALKACFTIKSEPLYNNVGAFYSAECSQNAESYRWYMGEGTIIDEDGHNFAYTHSGTYTISLVVKRGEQKDSIAQTVEVKMPEVILHDNEDIWEDITWEKGVHEIKGTLSVVEGTLTIPAGTVVRLQPDAAFNVGNQSAASIIAHGTASNPIRFTSAQSTPAAGDWNDLHIGQYATNPSFQHCIFEYGGLGSIYKGVITATYGASFSLENCTIRHSATNGIFLRDESYFNHMQNNTIENIEGYAIMVSPFQAKTIGTGNAISSKGILLDDVALNRDVHLHKQSCSYIVPGDVEAGSAEGITITLDAGVHLSFMEDKAVRIGRPGKATLLANGTAQDPVRFSAFDPDDTGTKRWGGIRFDDQNSPLTSLSHCIIEEVESYRQGAVIEVFGSAINMEHCSISGDETIGIDLRFGGNLTRFAHNDIGAVDSYSLRIPLTTLPIIETNNTFSGGRQIWLNAGNITEAETNWPNYGVPYFLKGGYILYNSEAAGAKLTIEAGVHVRIAATTTFEVGVSSGPGTLIAIGTAAAPIRFTLAEETVTADQPEWKGFWIRADTGSESHLEHAYISGCETGIDISGSWDSPEGVPAIIRCTFENISQYGISNGSANPLVIENTFNNIGWSNTSGI